MTHKAIGTKFLHDLAGPLTVTKTLVRKQMKDMDDMKTSVVFKKQIERMKKIVEAVDKLEMLHADYKAYLVTLKD